MKNWTLRQRILASFAVIIAIMLLMVVVSYSRLLKIEASETSVRDDAVPGVYYSSMIRSAWVDSYLEIQKMLGLEEGQGVTEQDLANFKDFEQRLEEQMANYATTIQGAEDRTEFDAFQKAHQNFTRILATVLDLHKNHQEQEAIQLFNEQLTPAWVTGRLKLNDIIRENKAVADHATAAIDDAVVAAKISMGVSLFGGGAGGGALRTAADARDHGADEPHREDPRNHAHRRLEQSPQPRPQG